MISQNYFSKIVILFAFTFASIFAVWYVLIREESADWLTELVVHQASPYAVSTDDQGRVTISNLLLGYEFSLPEGFKTNGARNLSFYLDNGGEKECETRHYNKRAGSVKTEAKNIVFELVNKNEAEACGKYLDEIEKSVIGDKTLPFL